MESRSVEVKICVESYIKDKVTKLYARLGLSLNEAINLF